MKELISPQIAYFRGSKALPLQSALEPIDIDTSSWGPCERFFREASSPDIDDLDSNSAYSIGFALARCGYELDRGARSAEDAFVIYGELIEQANGHMQQHRSGRCGPLTADIIISIFEGITATNKSEVNSIRRDVKRILNSQNDLQRKLQAVRDANKSVDKVIYADPTVEAAVNELSDSSQTYRVEARIYNECEVANWHHFVTWPELLPAPTFKIDIVDATWKTLPEDPTLQIKTDWMIFDGRGLFWYIYLCEQVTGISLPLQTQVVGVVINSETGQTHCIESSAIFIPDVACYRGWACDASQADRLLRAALSFMLLLQDRSVVTADPNSETLSVKLREGLSVDAVIGPVLQHTNRGW